MNISPANQTSQPKKMLVVSDIGRDQDDETTMVALAQLVATDKVDLLGVVANLQPSDRRACLAKGTLQTLGLGDVPVAIGSAAGQTTLKPHDHEFAAPYMADPSEVLPDGQALLRDKLAASPDHSVTLLLISGMTDGYELVHGNPALAQQKIDRVVIMGGVTCDKENHITLDDQGYLTPATSANNNTFDMPAAKGLYRELQDLHIPMTVVGKNTAYAAAVSKQFFEDLGATGHPVGERLRDTQKESLDGLWHRTNLAADDPERGGLPAACNREWFLKTFCSGEGQDVPADSSIWDKVTKLNPYDGVAMLAAVEPEQFSPTHVNVLGTQHEILGLTVKDSGVNNPAELARHLGEISKQALLAHNG